MSGRVMHFEVENQRLWPLAVEFDHPQFPDTGIVELRVREL